MSSGKSIKEYFGQFSVGALAGAAGTLIASTFLAWWNWAAVKAFFASVGAGFADIGAWLMRTTAVYHVVILADLLVLAALLSWVALWWYRSRASSAPVVVPVAMQPGLPADFNPTQLQRAIVLVLMQRWQRESDLQCVVDEVERIKAGLVPQGLARAHIAHDLELLEAANVVSIDRLGVDQEYYRLTTLGRNWIIQKLEEVKNKAKDKAATGE